MRVCPCMSACFYLCVCLSLRVYFCIHISTSVDRHSLCIICPTISLFQWISLSLSLSLSLSVSFCVCLSPFHEDISCQRASFSLPVSVSFVSVSASVTIALTPSVTF